jgi:hypothetical protein
MVPGPSQRACITSKVPEVTALVCWAWQTDRNEALRMKNENANFFFIVGEVWYIRQSISYELIVQLIAYNQLKNYFAAIFTEGLKILLSIGEFTLTVNVFISPKSDELDSIGKTYPSVVFL